MNSSRSIVVFLIIFLIAAAFWGAIQYFRIYGDTRQAPVPPPFSGKEERMIRITASGFDPIDITIKKDETVIFVNNDSRPHWPASAVHPLHTTCPGFDALRGLTEGERYSYTFSQSQTCPFHDHLNPLLTGRITIQ